MNTLRSGTAVLALLWLASSPSPARATGLKHEVSIYLDEKEEPLRLPEGVACGDKGVIVVADTGNGRLLTYSWRDGKLTGGKPIKIAEATVPVRLQVDSKGNLLVLDRRSRRIVRVDTAGKFAGAVEWRGAVNSSTIAPIAFKLDGADNLYVLDVTGRRVVVSDPGGKVSRDLPLPGGGSEFTDVFVDGGGRILAVDAVGSRLWIIEAGAKEWKQLGAPLKDRISFPVYLTGAEGKLYLVDQNGNGIAILSGDGGFLGRELDMGWLDGKVYYPGQMCVSAEGHALVADRANNRVQLFSVSR